jgi:hypothetical protein
MGNPKTTPADPQFVDTPIGEAYASLRAKALAAVDELTSEVLLTADSPARREPLPAPEPRWGWMRTGWAARTRLRVASGPADREPDCDQMAGEPASLLSTFQRCPLVLSSPSGRVPSTPPP